MNSLKFDIQSTLCCNSDYPNKACCYELREFENRFIIILVQHTLTGLIHSGQS